MSRKPETVFSSGVNAKLPLTLYRMKNNNPFYGGIPDFWYSGQRADLWVEYKYVDHAPRTGLKANLSALQTKWLHDRHYEGRNVAVIIGMKGGGVILERLAWEKPLIDCKFSSTAAIAQWILEKVS